MGTVIAIVLSILSTILLGMFFIGLINPVWMKFKKRTDSIQYFILGILPLLLIWGFTSLPEHHNDLKHMGEFINGLKTENLSLILALVSVLVTPGVSLYVSKRQIMASVRSKNRQEWINRLRDNVADVIGKIEILTEQADKQGLDIYEALPKYEVIHNEIELIQLYINPTEGKHKDLLKYLNELDHIVLNAMHGGETNFDELKKSKENTVSKTQEILKEEWKRVKKGE